MSDGECHDRGSEATRFVIAAGTTQTAEIERISAAGASPELMEQTPSADVETEC